MPIKTRSYLKAKFENGDIPNQNDFVDLFDTFIAQSDDQITIGTSADKNSLVGVNVKDPKAPVSILPDGKKESVLDFCSKAATPLWRFSLLNNEITRGFHLGQVLQSGTALRLFISEQNGKMGVGTVTPSEKLSIEESNPAGYSGLSMLNTAVSSQHPGWGLGHSQDLTIPSRNGALGIFESATATGQRRERMTVMGNTGFVGINEKTPDTYLHVSRLASEANAPVDLRPNTGIAEFGPITQSIVLDFQGIQARKGVYNSNVLQLNADTLHLQNLTGDILIHGQTTNPESQKVIVKSSGSVGIGETEPREKLEINGRLIIGDNGTAPGIPGSLRWNGTDFFAFKGTNWVSLTESAGFWSAAGTDKITYDVPNAKVGIGIDVPTSALHLVDNTEVLAGSTAARIVNNSATTGSSSGDSRIGLEITCSGTWSTETLSKNVALYASAAGSGSAHANLAAVLAGSVSIGAMSNSAPMVGANGTNVLVLQNGVAPATQVGGSAATNGGVQIYSTTSTTRNYSTFSITNGNGEKIKLFKTASITPVNTGTVDLTYGQAEADVINNLRTRIGELEALLVSTGLLAVYVAPPPIAVGGGNA
jgi:hypothetical protein